MDKKRLRSKLEIIDVYKLQAQYQAGISIRKLSQMWDIPYASLYRALKQVERDEVTGRGIENEAAAGSIK